MKRLGETMFGRGLWGSRPNEPHRLESGQAVDLHALAEIFGIDLACSRPVVVAVGITGLRNSRSGPASGQVGRSRRWPGRNAASMSPLRQGWAAMQ